MKENIFRLAILALVFSLTFSGIGTQVGGQLQGSSNLIIPENKEALGSPDPSLSEVDDRLDETRLSQAIRNLPIIFIQNQGQLDHRVAYYLQGKTTIYFTADGLIIRLSSPITETFNDLPHLSERSKLNEVQPSESPGWVFKLEFVGTDKTVLPLGQEKAQSVVSYFQGNPKEWHTALPTYHRLVYSNLWPGIDLVYSGTADHLKYEFVVRPGTDPNLIRLAYTGINDLRKNQRGELEVITPFGKLIDEAPNAFQVFNGRKTPVAAAYRIQSPVEKFPKNSASPSTNRSFIYSFQVFDYDPKLPLIIDPAVVVWSSLIGGGSNEAAEDIALGVDGSVYITGYTYSDQTEFPVLIGPDLTFSGSRDAFVVKFTPELEEIIYAGFIGGSGGETANSIAIDLNGAAYIAGTTTSDQSTFPVILGPGLTFNGNTDAYVAKIQPDGSGLIYAGYIGGFRDEIAYQIAVDPNGAAYISGVTNSDQATFPVAVGPDLTQNGWYDVFVAKLKPDGSGITFCGYIGGKDSESSHGIALDNSGAIYITGDTDSNETTFPVLNGPDLTYNGGSSDAFVVKLESDGSKIIYAGYIGGSGSEISTDITVDAFGSAYITGGTTSTETTFPVKIGPDLTQNGGEDAFVVKIISDGSGLEYAGFIGGNELDEGNAIGVDHNGAAYITGETSSRENTFPTIGGPDYYYNGGHYDAFVAQVLTDGSKISFSGYIGGIQNDYGFGIANDADGTIYVTGFTESYDFPAQYGPTFKFNGGQDVFITKVELQYHTTFLPFVYRCCDLLYADYFSNPASGWPVGDNGEIRAEYLNGEYRLLLRSTQRGFVVRPGVLANFNNIISVDVRNQTGLNGSYGIAFGIEDDWDEYYTLEIYPDGWYGLYKYSPYYTVLAEGFSPAIHQGSAKNRLSVESTPTTLRAYANGELLATYAGRTYASDIYFGLAVFSYNHPNLDVYFDNFTMYPYDCGRIFSSPYRPDIWNKNTGSSFIEIDPPKEKLNDKNWLGQK